MEILGRHVTIEHYHFRVYPVDPDDVPFFLCAVNGAATHLVTYDSDFEPLRNNQWFRLCTPIELLGLLR
jgi:predicted nucleic acid-binding protein